VLAKVIKLANDECEYRLKKTDEASDQKYSILLILTNGNSPDLEDSIDEVVRASALPLSIIIVGIGNCNF
jgi:hypothetical protein